MDANMHLHVHVSICMHIWIAYGLETTSKNMFILGGNLSWEVFGVRKHQFHMFLVSVSVSTIG